jgi:UDP-glucose 4-epimerase
VVDAYVAAGHEVHVLDNLSTGERKNLNKSAVFHERDLRDADTADFVRALKPEVVNHHAAQISVSVSVREPAVDAGINLLGLLNLLSGLEPGVTRRVVFASSGGTVYGEPDVLPATEAMRLDPRTPYGIAKAASEWYLRFFAGQVGFSTSFLRYANVYGPRQNAHGEAGVVAIFCNRLLAGQPCTIHGDGEHVRDYVFVGDVARASLLALDKPGDHAVNIGTGVGTTTNALYAELARIARGPAPVHGPARPGDLRASILDPTLAGRVLGWTPMVSLAQGLEVTYASFGG